MTKDEMLLSLGTMVDETDNNTLSTYLARAEDAIINRLYPYAKDDEELSVPRKYHGLQLEIAAFMINKRGAEGQKRHSENGISRDWGSSDVPEELLSRITPYVGVIGE